jgi:hypothetical protein
VKTNLHYVREGFANDFLEKVLSTCHERKYTVPKAHRFWRARRGCKTELVTKKEDDIEVVCEDDLPYMGEEMKPISNWQCEGRANPRGIPYLYLATTRNTALAEIRPWIGSKISVAQFKIRRDLNLIDCSKDHSKEKILRLIDNQTLSREDGMWTAIDQAFATPVTRDDEGGDYIPTQIIAEMLKCHGFDGKGLSLYVRDHKMW